jgi:hypothetical protein
MELPVDRACPMPIAPVAASDYVLAFIRERLGVEPMPTFLVPAPGDGAVPIRCFDNVYKQVQCMGGEACVGWAIWEWPGVFIEAERHCVWRRTDGALVDITPPPGKDPRILFQPDPAGVMESDVVDNVRQALRSDPDIDRFLQLASFVGPEMAFVQTTGQRLQGVRAEAFKANAAEKNRIGKLLEERYGAAPRVGD